MGIRRFIGGLVGSVSRLRVRRTVPRENRIAYLTTPAQFSRYFRRAMNGRSTGVCYVCHRPVAAAEARIISLDDQGQARLVCDSTNCILDHAVGAGRPTLPLVAGSST